MADKARKWTDKELAKIERNITEIYERAEKEMKEKWDAYIKRGEKRISAIEKDYRDALKVGDEQIISQQKERLKKAKEEFLIKNEQYKAMVDSVTLDMAKTNEEALSYIYSRLPEIYATNFEQAREIIENFDSNLVLPNKNVIKNMVINGDIKTPFMKTDNFIKIPKDQRWNTKFINSEVLQGIIQGEDMRTISNRIFPEIMEKSPKEGLSKKELKSLEKRNRNAAIRNARTLVTGAENKGRFDSYHNLQEQGAVLKKVWIATGDSRTRDWHIVMDGQEVDIDEDFVDGNGNRLEYPADPTAEAETVYNCRCSMRTHIIGFRKSDGSISYIDYEEESGLHEQQIAEEIERRQEAASAKNEIDFSSLSNVLDKEKIEEAKEYAMRMQDADVQKFNKIFNDANFESGTGNHYDKYNNIIQISSEESYDSTVFHESTHWFDYNQKYTITDDWGHYDRKYDNEGNLIKNEWIPNIQVIKENAGFSEYISWEWDKLQPEKKHSKAGDDLINFVKKVKTSDTYGYNRNPNDVEHDLNAIRTYLQGKDISTSDPDFVHLSDFISAMTYDANLGSLTTGGHGYDYWVSSNDNRVTEITAGYNLLRATGREDLIAVERELAPNLMNLIEKEWSKIW